MSALLTQHAGDCSIYSSLINHRPEDGICTCGYGLSRKSDGDRSQMYSEERKEATNDLLPLQARIDQLNAALEELRAELEDSQIVRTCLKTELIKAWGDAKGGWMRGMLEAKSIALEINDGLEWPVTRAIDEALKGETK